MQRLDGMSADAPLSPVTAKEPTVLCVRITAGEFIELVLPAALFMASNMGREVARLESTNYEVDVQYVWR